jgi:MFS family permease
MSNHNNARMTSSERKHTVILACIFSIRMLGLFMVLPVMPLYLDSMPGATAQYIGISLGVYGLTQAILQLPFGFLSDYYGRKKIMLLGLMLFMLGSLVAAYAHDIWGVIIGRALQGSGAIGATIMAYAADITRAEVRTRAFAVIGVAIGSSFLIALIIGPIIDAYFGLTGIFYFTAVTCVFCMLLLRFLPQMQITSNSFTQMFVQVKKIIFHPELRRLNISVSILHACLVATFLVFPLKVLQLLNLTRVQAWQFYVPIMISGFLMVVPFLRSSDKRGTKSVFMCFIVLLAISQAGMMAAHKPILVVIASLLFFAAFNFLEASLPAMVSQLASPQNRGATLGVYSCSQFFGMFMGGILGGIAQQYAGASGIMVLCLTLTIIWFAVMQQFRQGRVLETAFR